VTSLSDTMDAGPGAVRVIPSRADLLADLGTREPFKTSDSLSGSRFERVRYEGEPMILKYVSLDDDWIMRALPPPPFDLAWYLAVNLRPPAAQQGRRHRRLPSVAGTAGRRHIGVVEPAAGSRCSARASS
jgi:hypothetical protein